MTSTITGSWNLDKAIIARWDAQSLDTAFKSYWAVADRTKHLSLIDSEQRPAGPFPYCVYMVERPNVTGNSTGTSDSSTTRKYVKVIVQFDIYAQNSTTQNGKEIARTLAAAVADKFDPKNDWGIDVDYIMRVDRITDFSDRADDDVWLWTVQYEITLDQIWDR